MIKRIHLDPKLEKCLAALRRGSRQACLAANRVESILAEVELGNLPTGAVNTLTRNGEARIKGCRKYDLGGGYRLVTLKQGHNLYLLFAGTHDECSRWIENNREHLPLEMIAERCRTVFRTIGESALSVKASQPTEPAAEDDWMSPLTDQDLRMVFRGLVEGK